VHSLDEHRQIADLARGIPVCLLGPTMPWEAEAVVAAGVEPTVSEIETAEALAAAQRACGRGRLPIHIKVETGTHRQGILIDEVPRWCALLRDHLELHFRGLHTHYANIEDTTDQTIARRQLARLQEARRRFIENGQPPEMLHSACSAAAIVMEQTHGDLVRLGIASYGLWPSRETFLSALLSHRMGPELLPVLSWKTRIAQVKDVPVGEYIGYGCSVRTTHAMRLAVLPVGYYDGYDRRLSGRGYVLVRGRRAPVAGRVCMNMSMIDITDMPDVRLGEEVILLGRNGSESVSADDLAQLCGTINYEIVSRIGQHIPRVLREPRENSGAR
jgi:alanine racemase